MTSWTSDQDETLKTMLEAGSTVAEAAGKIGVTRNAAMGRAFRKGFQMNSPNQGGWDEKRRSAAKEARMARIETRAKAERKHPLVLKPKSREFDANRALFKPKAAPKPQPVQRPTEAPPSLRLTLLEIRDNDCHFIADEYPPYSYCGAPAIELRPYCRFHADLVYQPVRPRAT